MTMRLSTATIAAAAVMPGLFAALTFWFVSQGAAQTGTDAARPFQQIAAILQHPRCLNCHTMTTFPKQGNDRHRHIMNVARGADGHGAPGLSCATCHGRHNNADSGVPGADEDWHLAPLSMGWEGLTASELCRTLKNPAKNGGRTGVKIIEHLNTNLVRWAWDPGVNAKGTRRDTPPGSHDGFVALMEDWVRSGAACPNS
jgi:hypothetical protein